MGCRDSSLCTSLPADTQVPSLKTTDSLSGAKLSCARRLFFYLKNSDPTNKSSSSQLEKRAHRSLMRILTCTLGAPTIARASLEFWKVKHSQTRTSTCPSLSKVLPSSRFLKCQLALILCWPLVSTMISLARPCLSLLFKQSSLTSSSCHQQIIIKKIMKLRLQLLMRSIIERKRDLSPLIPMTLLLTLSSRITIHIRQSRRNNRKVILQDLQSITRQAI